MIDLNVIIHSMFVAFILVWTYRTVITFYAPDQPTTLNIITVPIIRVISCISISKELTHAEGVLLMDVAVYTMTHQSVRDNYDDNFYAHEMMVYSILIGGIAKFLDSLKEYDKTDSRMEGLLAILKERNEYKGIPTPYTSKHLYKLCGPKWPDAEKIMSLMNKSHDHMSDCMKKNVNVMKLIKENEQ